MQHSSIRGALRGAVHGSVRPLVLVAAGTAVALGVAACGSSSGTAAAAVSPSARFSQGQQRIPGTSGLVAAISGTTLQVQSSSAQTAVTYSSATRFTASTTVALSAVKAGECATVSGSDTSGTFTATTIRISEPVGGSCTAAGFGGFGGLRGTGTRPSGAPSGGFGGGTGGAGIGGGTPPSGSAGGGFGGGIGSGFAFLTGSVASVSSTGLVIDGSVRTRGTATSASSSPATSSSAATTTVTVGSTTTITATATATASSLKVGVCVTAIGTTGTTGAVAARTIAVSAPVDGACTSGFGGRPGTAAGGQGAGGQGA